MCCWYMCRMTHSAGVWGLEDLEQHDDAALGRWSHGGASVLVGICGDAGISCS